MLSLEQMFYLAWLTSLLLALSLTLLLTLLLPGL